MPIKRNIFLSIVLNPTVSTGTDMSPLVIVKLNFISALLAKISPSNFKTAMFYTEEIGTIRNTPLRSNIRKADVGEEIAKMHSQRWTRTVTLYPPKKGQWWRKRLWDDLDAFIRHWREIAPKWEMWRSRRKKFAQQWNIIWAKIVKKVFCTGYGFCLRDSCICCILSVGLL